MVKHLDHETMEVKMLDGTSVMLSDLMKEIDRLEDRINSYHERHRVEATIRKSGGWAKLAIMYLLVVIAVVVWVHWYHS